MKILFLSHYFPPEGNAPASRTYEHCVRWARAGHDVTVVTSAPNVPTGKVYDGYRNTWRTQEEMVDGIRVLRTWTYLAANAGNVRRTLNYLSYMVSALWTCLRIGSPDVIVATSPQFFCGCAGVLVAQTKRVPLVLEIRDIWPESIGSVGAIRNRWLLRHLEALERWMYRSATHIVTVGRGYRDSILRKIDVHDRISLVYNGVDLDKFQSPRDVSGWNDPRLDGKFVCSYVGTIGMAHGLEVVLDAAELLRERGRNDIAFCLIGDGADRERLAAAVETRQLNDLVVFLGQRPKAEIPHLLARSNACLIHLKKCDLFGTAIPSKMFESMAMEKPIIMGVEGEAREIVMAAEAAVPMDPGDPVSLVAAVERLADDPVLAKGLAATAREFVATSFSRETFAARYLRLLEAVVTRTSFADEACTGAPNSVSAAPALAMVSPNRDD